MIRHRHKSSARGANSILLSSNLHVELELPLCHLLIDDNPGLLVYSHYRIDIRMLEQLDIIA